MYFNKSIKTIVILLIIISSLFAVTSCKKRPETSITETKDYYSYINVSYGTHERHYLDLVIPKGDGVPSGMILYVHGGGWHAGDKEIYTDTLKSNADRGYISAALNYRYADGKNATCEEILDDIDAALTTVKTICSEKGITVDKVMLTGGSAGGHLSLMHAYARANSAPITPVAVVSYSGPTDLADPNFFTTQYEEDVRKMISKVSRTDIVKNSVEYHKEELLIASPISYVNENTVPTVICHGTVDDVVPYSNAVTLLELLTDHGVECELITFDDSGHGLEADPEASQYSDKRFWEMAEKYLR